MHKPGDARVAEDDQPDEREREADQPGEREREVGVCVCVICLATLGWQRSMHIYYIS